MVRGKDQDRIHLLPHAAFTPAQIAGSVFKARGSTTMFSSRYFCPSSRPQPGAASAGEDDYFHNSNPFALPICFYQQDYTNYIHLNNFLL